MSLGQNLQFLRKMRNKMSQEELAEKLGVSRQTISKWELDTVYPEMDKVIELCKFFSCTMDQLVREDMNAGDDFYSDIRMEKVDSFLYMKYAVISVEPEDDAIEHVRRWAEELHVDMPNIIGWDFPVVSQEQKNVFNMHGYAAALVLEKEIPKEDAKAEIIWQEKQNYIAITIRHYISAPYYVIPNAYKVLMTHMKINGIRQKHDKNVISCFEKEYELDGVDYMDVYIATE